MEKSSEKVIAAKMQPNPFNNMLSEVQLKLNKPKSTKKIQNYALQFDPNVNRSSSNITDLHEHPNPNLYAQPEPIRQEQHSIFVINAPLRTKNSSDTGKQDIEKEIISQWLVGFMGKRRLLGVHWEQNLKEKQIEVMSDALNKIKIFNCHSNSQTDPHQANIARLVLACSYLEKTRKKQSFSFLKQFYRDDLLFGLSNTIGEQKNNSFLLKINSEYDGNSSDQKKSIKNMKIISRASSQSNQLMGKKVSESGQASEDLSALILNHNKLKLSQELNRSNPNIPKAKQSLKNIKTSKQIGQLSLETRKMISSQGKMNEEDSQLPLESKKHLANTKKQLTQEEKPNQDQHITLTFVLKNLHPTSVLHEEKERTARDLQMRRKEEQSRQRNNFRKILDHNTINRLPISESFYHHANPIPIGFTQNEHKRPTSVQVKPIPTFFDRQDYPNNHNNISSKRILSNQYYPQESFRDAQPRFITNNPVIERVRPKSATPRITFTFCSSPAQPRKDLPFPSAQLQPQPQPQSQSQSQAPSQAQNLNHTEHEQHDYILQSIIKPMQIIRQPQLDRNRNKLQIISPSRKQNQKKQKIQTKINFDSREHIKNIILPPAFNDYHAPQKKKTIQGIKLAVNDNQVVFNDNLQRSTALNSLFGSGGSPRESNINREQMRWKSPKDKIFVTYKNSNN